jgi:hypothetical protein
MSLRLTRRVAILVIGLLAFAQASVVLAACPLERSTMSNVMAAAESDEPCNGCGSASVKGFDSLYANRCVVHCTADLQLTGEAIAVVKAPGDTLIVYVPPADLRRALRMGLDGPPPGTPPRRILLHSFLI